MYESYSSERKTSNGIEFAETLTFDVEEKVVDEVTVATVPVDLNGAKRPFKKYREILFQHFIMRYLPFLIVIISGIFSIRFFLNSEGVGILKRAAPPPMPFFSSYIRDQFNGDDADVTNSLKHSEIVVAMYYAPWSLPCRLMRSIFQTVAESFSENSDISFVAINCFVSSGQCRKMFKLGYFPVIIAHVRRAPILYFGEYGADYLRRWVLHIRSPMKRITNDAGMVEFLVENTCAVVSFFPPSVNISSIRISSSIFCTVSSILFSLTNCLFSIVRESKLYKQYLYASMLFAQNDRYIGQAAFALTTDVNFAATVGIHPSSLRFYGSNYQMDFMLNDSVSAIDIVNWLYQQKCFDSSLQWIAPDPSSGLKGEQLHSILKQGPTILLFTKREVLYPHKSEISIFEQLIMEYNSCDWGNSDIHLKERAQKREYLRQKRFNSFEEARNLCNESRLRRTEIVSCCLRNKHGIISRCASYDTSFSSTNARLRLAMRRNVSKLTEEPSCRVVYHSGSSAEEIFQSCCSLYDTNIGITQFVDNKRTSCENFKMSSQLRYQLKKSSIDVDESDPLADEVMRDRFCNKNGTFRFVGADMEYYSYLLSRNGIKLDKTVVMIADSLNEQTYVMTQPFSRGTLRDFLRSFENGSLTRHFVSEKEQQLPFSYDSSHPYNFAVAQLTSDKFRAIVDKESECDILLLFHRGSSNGASGSILYIYHTVAHYFKPYDELIKIVMIDVSKNELPWRFKIDRVPFILFLPAQRRSASSYLPQSVSLTVPNIIAFVLARCQLLLRWQISAAACSQTCIRRNTFVLIDRIRKLKSEIVSLMRFAQTAINHAFLQLVDKVIQRRGLQLKLTRKSLEFLNLSRKNKSRNASNFHSTVDQHTLKYFLMRSGLLQSSVYQSLR